MAKVIIGGTGGYAVVLVALDWGMYPGRLARRL